METAERQKAILAKESDWIPKMPNAKKPSIRQLNAKSSNNKVTSLLSRIAGKVHRLNTQRHSIKTLTIKS